MLSEGYLLTYGWVQRLCRHSPYADCLSVFNYNLIDLGVTLQVQVLVNGSRRVDVGMGRVTSTAGLGKLLARDQHE